MQRRKPLRRNTQLKRTPFKKESSTEGVKSYTTLKRTALKPVGEVKRRKIPYQQQERTAVTDRAGDKCEVHKMHRGTDWHHIFNRTIHGIGDETSEPWASSRELTCLLCHELHMEIEAGRASNIQSQLEVQALIRLCMSVKIPKEIILSKQLANAPHVDTLRYIIKWAVENDKHLPHAPENET